MAAADISSMAQESPVSLIERICKKIRVIEPYASIWQDVETRVHKRMRQLCQEIRAKPGWIDDIKLPDSRSQLFADVIARCEYKQEAEVIFQKLDYLASINSETDIEMSTVDCVWTADSLIDNNTKEKLKSLALLLEAESYSTADLLDSNTPVKKLIDPYLYPFVVGLSRILSKPIPSPAHALSTNDPTYLLPNAKELKDFLDSNFKVPDGSGHPDYSFDGVFTNIIMLPTEFFVDSSGDVTIGSYINNLHPARFLDYYPTIATIFSRFVPLFEQTLADITHPLPTFKFNQDRYIKYHEEAFDPSRSNNSDSENYAYFCQLVESDSDIIAFSRPDRLNPHKSLFGQRLQVSIEMKNITLTPEFPTHDGETWHIAGLEDECVIATGIYYYDCDNIAGSGLMFREFIFHDNFQCHLREGEDITEFNVLFDTFDDIDDPSGSHPVSQEIGQIDIKDGQCVVFPNTYQSRDIGFKLADPTRPGHCKTLVFYLLNPSNCVPSTAIVPPQQQAWWRPEVMKYRPMTDLPHLITDRIFDYIEWPLSTKDAAKIREQTKELEYDEIQENWEFGFEIETYYAY